MKHSIESYLERCSIAALEEALRFYGHHSLDRIDSYMIATILRILEDRRRHPHDDDLKLRKRNG